MINEKIIETIKTTATDVVNYFNDDFSMNDIATIQSCEYDKPYTSYIVELTAFETTVDIIYIFDDDEIIVHDCDNNRDVMNLNSSGAIDLSLAVYHYLYLMHDIFATDINFLL